MHPEIERELARQRVEELRRAGAIARLRAAVPRAARETEVVIRLARREDALAVEALAVLDGAESPDGRVLVAEVNGEIRAALPLDTRAAFADPFRRTADLVALLEARAQQVAGERGSHRRFGWLRPVTMRRSA